MVPPSSLISSCVTVPFLLMRQPRRPYPLSFCLAWLIPMRGPFALAAPARNVCHSDLCSSRFSPNRLAVYFMQSLHSPPSAPRYSHFSTSVCFSVCFTLTTMDIFLVYSFICPLSSSTHKNISTIRAGPFSVICSKVLNHTRIRCSISTSQMNAVLNSFCRQPVTVVWPWKNVHKCYVDGGSEHFREKMNRIWCLNMGSEITV